ncbi:MAG: hypothetical protein WCH43_06545 [Verrucomicrobiota bacterium]
MPPFFLPVKLILATRISLQIQASDIRKAGFRDFGGLPGTGSAFSNPEFTAKVMKGSRPLTAMRSIQALLHVCTN